jgi:hypothetical protein
MAGIALKPRDGVVKGAARGFIHGLGQLVSIGASTPRIAFPDTKRSPAEALKGDWDKLGGDMKRAATKVIGESGKR